MSRRSLRFAVLVFAFLVGGAIINVAVAWAAATWTSIVTQPSAMQLNQIRGVSSEETKLWLRWAPKQLTSRPLLASRISTWGYTASNVTADRTADFVNIEMDGEGKLKTLMIRSSPPPLVFDFGFMVFAGWPMRALRGARFVEGDGQLDQHNLAAIVEIKPAAGSATLVHAIPIEERIWVPREFRILPTDVIPLGFAVNTFFYAAILWVLFAVPGVLRRQRRRRRGLCAACGYSLRGSASEKCPECGVSTGAKAVKISRV